MRSVVLCPGCGVQNSPSISFCYECRTSLRRGRQVSRDEARRLLADVRAGQALRRRLRNHAFLATVIVVAVVWGSYTAYNFLDDPDSPTSQISAELASGDWPMFQRDPAHSGFTPLASFTPEGTVRWTFGSDGLIINPPVIVDGAVYLTAGVLADQKVAALDAETGGLLWQHPVAAAIDSSLAVAGGLVFVAVRDGRILALNASDGSINWEFEIDGPMFGSPTVYDGIVYLGTWNKIVYALDAATGKLLWNRLVGGRVTSTPVVNDEIIAFIATNNRVYILDAHSGKQRLEYRTSQSSGSVAVNRERVYVAATRGILTAIDWTKSNYPLENPLRSFRLNLYAMGLIGNFPIKKGLVWSVGRPNERFMGTPAVADGMVYVTSGSGKLLKFDEARRKTGLDIRCRGREESVRFSRCDL